MSALLMWLLAGASQARPALQMTLDVDATDAPMRIYETLVAVNGRRFSIDELKRVIAGSKSATGPTEFIIENGSYMSVVKVDYHGGARYPHLERASGDDVLTSIAAARVK